MSRKNSILIVDDDDILRRLIKDRLLLSGDFEIAEAETASAALALISDHRPDLMILDYMLPDCNGVEMLERLAAQSLKIPTIMITAYFTAALAKQVSGLNVRTIFSKPLELRELLTAINQYLLGSEYKGIVENGFEKKQINKNKED